MISKIVILKSSEISEDELINNKFKKEEGYWVRRPSGYSAMDLPAWKAFLKVQWNLNCEDYSITVK